MRINLLGYFGEVYFMTQQPITGWKAWAIVGLIFLGFGIVFAACNALFFPPSPYQKARDECIRDAAKKGQITPDTKEICDRAGRLAK
jgi:hypothetical protein